MEDNTSSMFEAKLRKGDLIGALDLSILEGENASKIAKKAIEELKNEQKKIEEKADAILEKYPKL